MSQLVIDKATEVDTVSVWLSLLDLSRSGDSTLALVAMKEVLTDAELFVALNMPASEFVEWFKKQTWQDFEQYEAAGNDAWAFTVLMNAKPARDKLGLLASQRAIGN